MSELDGGDKAFVGIISNGPSGNINNTTFAGPAPAKREEGEQIRIATDSVAAAALAAHKTIKHHDWVPLAMAQKEIELAVRRPTDAEVTRAQDILDKAKKKVLTTMPEIYARESTL